MKRYLLTALLFSPSAFADVGPDYVCQDKLEVNLPSPKGAIDYWTDITTSWTNTYSGMVEVFVRGPGLVTERVEITGEAKDQRWLVPPKGDFPAQGVYLTFTPDECTSVGDRGTYCYRDRDETSSSILAAGVSEAGKKRQYREVEVEAKSVQALITDKQTLVSYVLPSGKRVSLGLSCDSDEWYPHIPMDELNRTDLQK